MIIMEIGITPIVCLQIKYRRGISVRESSSPLRVVELELQVWFAEAKGTKLRRKTE
jgi:hypothetical protein